MGLSHTKLSPSVILKNIWFFMHSFLEPDIYSHILLKICIYISLYSLHLIKMPAPIGRVNKIVKLNTIFFIFLTTLKPSIGIDSYIDKLRKSSRIENGLFISYSAKFKNIIKHLYELFNVYIDKQEKYYGNKMRWIYFSKQHMTFHLILTHIGYVEFKIYIYIKISLMT